MDYDHMHPNFVSLTDSIWGHLMTSVIPMPGVWLLLWLCSRQQGIAADWGTVALLSIAACALAGVLVALVQRPVVVAARHPGPGGWAFAVWEFVIPPVAGAVLGALESPSVAGLAAASMFLVHAAMALWTKPWRRGDDRADVRAKWERTKEMTVEQSMQDGWVHRR